MSELRRALDVREMTMGDTSLRIDYFHDADDAVSYTHLTLPTSDLV